MTGRRGDRLMILQRVGEHLHVDVAQALDLAVGNAALDELLLHGGDLGGLDVLDQLLEPRLDLLHRLAGVQVLDDRVQLGQARRVHRLCVGDVGDGRPRAGLPLDLRRDVVGEPVQRHVALSRDGIERRHPSDRPAQDRIGELLELRMVIDQEVQQERILLEQRVDGGLGGECQRRGGHTRLQRLGLASCRWYHRANGVILDLAQARRRSGPNAPGRCATGFVGRLSVRLPPASGSGPP